MLERAAGIEALGGLAHGFTDRDGGTSEAGFATLNLGRKWGDDPTRVDENLRRVGETAGFRPADLVLVHQVHGASVLRARDVQPDSRADALWLHRDDGPGVVGVLTADCVPILLADVAHTVVAAVHSGWRGTVAGVVPAAVSALAAVGAEPWSLRAAIGPCIEWPAFEVGPEVAAQFPDRHVRTDGLVRPHVDLVGMVRAQLEEAGVPPSCIERVGGCTHAEPRRYFSYRRDGPRTGQHLSFIGFAQGS
jgi:YfiH family protein